MEADVFLVANRDETGPRTGGIVEGIARHAQHDDGQSERASPETVDHMLGAFAHAMSNVINSIMAATQLADLLIAQNRIEEARESLARADSECMRAARLVRESHDFATFRPERGAGRVDIAAILRAACVAVGEESRIRIECPPELPFVRGDAAALRRLIVELIDNACEHGGSEILVRAARTDADDMIDLDVIDNGDGLRARGVFNAFITTDPVQHSGLGLAFARRIAEACGAEFGIDVDEEGTRFRVRLAVADEGDAA